MSGELHEISAAIGELRAEVRAGAQQREAMVRQLIEMNEKLAAVPQLAASMAEIKPKVEAHERMSNRGLGFLFGVSGVSSIGGAGIWEAASRLFKWKIGG